MFPPEWRPGVFMQSVILLLWQVGTVRFETVLGTTDPVKPLVRPLEAKLIFLFYFFSRYSHCSLYPERNTGSCAVLCSTFHLTTAWCSAALRTIASMDIYLSCFVQKEFIFNKTAEGIVVEMWKKWCAFIFCFTITFITQVRIISQNKSYLIL